MPLDHKRDQNILKEKSDINHPRYYTFEKYSECKT